MTEELKEQIHERVYNIKVPTLGFSRRDLFNIAMEYAEPREKRIEELEKENAELKRIIDNDVDKKIYVQLAKKAKLADVQEDQLTKAKICLEQLVSEITVGELEVDPNILQQAEQFLSEVEK